MTRLSSRTVRLVSTAELLRMRRDAVQEIRSLVAYGLPVEAVIADRADRVDDVLAGRADVAEAEEKRAKAATLLTPTGVRDCYLGVHEWRPDGEYDVDRCARLHCREVRPRA